MPAFFVTATGTDIGKTFVTVALARHLHCQGRKVAVLKPVISGFQSGAAADSDPALLLRAIGQEPSPAAIAAIAPWRYAAPLSPDMAARAEGRAIDFAALVAFCRKAVESAAEVVLIEGIGGLMVPLGADATVLDLIEVLRIPALLVAGTYVGSLSHTLSALDVFSHRGTEAAALVLNETPGSAATPEATRDSLRNFYPNLAMSILRRDPALNSGVFAALAEGLLQQPS